MNIRFIIYLSHKNNKINKKEKQANKQTNKIINSTLLYKKK